MALTAPASIENQNGELVFTGTNTTVSIFFNYLKAGRNTETFLEDYPKVRLQQVLDVLEMADQQLNSLA